MIHLAFVAVFVDCGSGYDHDSRLLVFESRKQESLKVEAGAYVN